MHEFELSEVKKSFFGHKALDGVTLHLARGSMNVLLGANGSGKSTLLKCLAGHQNWDSGEILWRGQSRRRDRRDFNRGLHLISEDIMPPAITLSELRELYGEIYGVFDDSIFERFLEFGNLPKTQNITTVSRGQKIQMLISLALATRPEVLLIDEATAVLDPFIRNRLVTEIEDANRRLGMTTVIATNIATELSNIKGRLLIMKGGRIEADYRDEQDLANFVKVRVDKTLARATETAGFCFIEENQDGSLSFIGQRANLAAITGAHHPDKRSLAIEEIFIYHSDRRSA